MKKLLFLLVLVSIEKAVQAQTRPPYIYTIKADSVLITNSCDTAELILENHTQNVPGFLFNKGGGRTEFRRPLQKINDTLYTIGIDSLKLPNAWVQGGNTWGTTGIFGTIDNNHIDFYTNNTKRGRWTNTGNLIIGNGNDNGTKLQTIDYGRISLNPNLSRSGDQILFGGYLNKDDGQNCLIMTTSDGANYHPVLIERDGNIGMGWGSANGWMVGHPTFRISANGTVSVESQYFYFGSTGGPYNSSALVTYVSNANEWLEGYGYPNNQNYYYFGTVLQTPSGSNVRAPLKISGRYLSLLSGSVSDVEAARISEAGNLLIGSTQDFGQKLQVKGNAWVSDTFNVSGSFIQGYTSTASFGNGLFFDQLSGMPRILSTGKIYYQSNYSGDQHVFENSIGSAFTGTLVTLDPGPYQDLPDGQLALKVFGRMNTPGLAVNMLGNTGIGTFTPSAQLHTTGTVRFAGLTNNDSLSRVIVSDANGNLYYRTLSSWALNDVHNSDLAINGTLSAQKMKITQTGPWPDYVFSNQYKLPTLLQLEQYIKQNNHLPDVPSATEVENNGIDVGNNQATLLKKIEELTLYMIEQEKKLQQQDEEISALKKQNKEVENLKQQMLELKTLIKSIQR
jgi:hypothetical protein